MVTLFYQSVRTISILLSAQLRILNLRKLLYLIQAGPVNTFAQIHFPAYQAPAWSVCKKIVPWILRRTNTSKHSSTIIILDTVYHKTTGIAIVFTLFLDLVMKKFEMFFMNTLLIITNGNS